MSEPQQLPEDVADSVFVYQLAELFAIVAYPFLSALLGGSLGIYGILLVLIGAARYCRSLEQRSEERSQMSPMLVQCYVVHLAKRFAWVRVGSVTLVTPFLRHPVGLIYFLIVVGLTVADVMWQSAKLGDMKAKESNQLPEPAAASGRDSS